MDYEKLELMFLAKCLPRDIHTRSSAALYKVAEDAVTADMRRSAKVVNFGVLYGAKTTKFGGV